MTKPIAANLISSTPSIAGVVGRERWQVRGVAGAWGGGRERRVRGVAGAGASGGGRDVAGGV
ncbi:hypothetical protein OG558_27970 [Kribbella sp. NBC_01510]|uniref:hypothetical protein n=1 Tax=Kribbella sp. NBC_01510 TaxID=2903581 RepID=UPI0038669E16